MANTNFILRINRFICLLISVFDMIFSLHQIGYIQATPEPIMFLTAPCNKFTIYHEMLAVENISKFGKSILISQSFTSKVLPSI